MRNLHLHIELEQPLQRNGRVSVCKGEDWD